MNTMMAPISVLIVPVEAIVDLHRECSENAVTCCAYCFMWGIYQQSSYCAFIKCIRFLVNLTEKVIFISLSLSVYREALLCELKQPSPLEQHYLWRAALSPVQSAEEGARRLFLPSIHTFSKKRAQPANVPVLVHLLELNLRSILQTDGEEDKPGQE